MTEESLHTSLLIAFSKGFGFRHLFAKKISALLANFTADEITVAQDENSIAQDFFNSKGSNVKLINLGKTRNEVKRSIAQFSHVVIFWDGDDLTDAVFFSKLLGKNLRIIPVQLAKVRNKDKEERFDVYIGRGTPWGNPFPIGLGGTGDSREVVIEKFRTYFFEQIVTDSEKHKALLSLRGYRLGCHCKPLACHGDIIATYLNSYEDEIR
jgi:hypothetical protein